MQPHEIAAHQIADAFDVMARCLPLLSAEQAKQLFPTLCADEEAARKALTTISEAQTRAAAAYRALAPFKPLNEEERQQLFEDTCEQVQDLSTKEVVREYVLDMTEWQLRAEYDDQQDYMREIEEGGDAGDRV